MKVALVLSVRAAGADRFRWRWQPEDGTPVPSKTFKYFFECCEDARKAGYECKFSLRDEATGAPPKRAQAARRARQT